MNPFDQYPIGSYWLSDTNNNIQRIEGHLTGTWHGTNELWLGLICKILVWITDPYHSKVLDNKKMHKLVAGTWPEFPSDIHCLNGGYGSGLIPVSTVHMACCLSTLEVYAWGTKKWLAQVVDEGDPSVGEPAVWQYISGVTLEDTYESIEFYNKRIAHFWTALEDLSIYNSNKGCPFPNWIKKGMTLE